MGLNLEPNESEKAIWKAGNKIHWHEVTDGQIRQLQREAGKAGDLDTVSVCRTACGDREEATQSEIKAARQRCADIIEAQQ